MRGEWATRIARVARIGAGGLVAFCLLLCLGSPLWAYEFVLRNGITVRGATGDLSSITENPLSPVPADGAVAARLIRFVDDGLRRVYFYERNIVEAREDTLPPIERIRLRQPRIANSGRRVAGLTSNVVFGPFDESGHRTVSVMTNRGLLESVQAITELTPLYARVEGLVSQTPVVWDMRVATSTLSRELMQRLVTERGEVSGGDGLLALVRLLIAADRFHDAAEVLNDALRQYPELKDREGLLQDLHQRRMRRLVQELQLRRSAGQHKIVEQLIARFPTEGVSGEILLEVREIAQSYADEQQRLTQLAERLRAIVGELDAAQAAAVAGPIEEIVTGLSVNNVSRLSDFMRLADGEENADRKLAWAISGWLMGSGQAVDSLSVAMSLVDVRNLVVEYLRATGPTAEADRQRLLDQILEREGGTPENVARILNVIDPPLAPAPDQIDATGAVTLAAASSLESQATTPYLVVLPPEYDPDRRYPTIVSLPNVGVELAQQAEWWTGVMDEAWGMRMGQASRHGFIVIVPLWYDPHQALYGYSVYEHARVLDVYRDALQRFAIDTDRVYLSGHMLGGDAAWDIGLAHPDLWAGMILIGASSDYGAKESPRYIARYAVNAKRLPMYFVFGELDLEKLNRNSNNLNDYLRLSGYDAMVVEYRGRGNEHFFEEIQRIFEWMSAEPQRREARPTERQFEAMRPWDNFFWCLELSDYPAVTITHPLLWGQSRRHTTADGEFRFSQRDRVTIKHSGGKAVLWLSPEWVDYSGPIRVTVNGQRGQPIEIRPQVSVLLEDARTRGDRRHPFWSRTEL